jgi:hypothetical protein
MKKLFILLALLLNFAALSVHAGEPTNGGGPYDGPGMVGNGRVDGTIRGASDGPGMVGNGIHKNG